MAGEGTPLSATSGALAPFDPDGITAARPATEEAAEATSQGGEDGRGAAATSPRASDGDRNAVVERLAKATGEGRITLEEFADAAGAAYAAVTVAELDDLLRGFGFVDHLPPPPSSNLSAPPVQQRAAGSNGSRAIAAPGGATASVGVGTASGAGAATSSPRGEAVVAFMSGASRRGRWTIGRRTRAVAFWGGVHLDLRQAVIESDVVEIDACAVMGGVHITVPEGIPVEMSGCVIMGGRTSRIADRPMLAGAPTIRVKARGMWGGVHVRSKPNRKLSKDRDGRLPATGFGAGASHAGHAAPDRPRGAESGDRGPDLSDRTGRQPFDLVRDVLEPVDVGHPVSNGSGTHPSGPASPNGSAHQHHDDAMTPAPTPSGDLLTIVCTDIVGSTRLAVSLGDQRWHALLTAHNTIVRDHLQRFGGTEVKTSGDGFLVTFTSARAALQFSMSLQEALASDRSLQAQPPIEVRIGVHAGEVERDGIDVIGRNVTIACRLCDAAAPGEVLASSVVADLTDSASDLAFGTPRDHSLSGIDRPVTSRPALRA